MTESDTNVAFLSKVDLQINYGYFIYWNLWSPISRS